MAEIPSPSGGDISNTSSLGGVEGSSPGGGSGSIAALGVQNDPRPKATISGATSIEFTFEFPVVTVKTESRTVSKEPIGATTVVQHLGQGPVAINVKGTCILDEAKKIDQLTAGEEVRFISHRWSGPAIVKDTDVRDLEEKSDKLGEWEWIFDYTINMVRADGEISGGGDSL